MCFSTEIEDWGPHGVPPWFWSHAAWNYERFRDWVVKAVLKIIYVWITGNDPSCIWDSMNFQATLFRGPISTFDKQTTNTNKQPSEFEFCTKVGLKSLLAQCQRTSGHSKISFLSAYLGDHSFQWLYLTTRHSPYPAYRVQPKLHAFQGRHCGPVRAGWKIMADGCCCLATMVNQGKLLPTVTY